MKTIKFRGKRTDNNEWVYGYYYYKWRTKQHIIHCSESQGVLVDKEFEIIGETLVENCTECFGTGINSYPNHDTAYPTCNVCNGKGYIDNKTTN